MKKNTSDKTKWREDAIGLASIDIEMDRLLSQAIEAEAWRNEVLPQLKKMVGKAFVFRRSCYSCPETKADYWDVYRLLQAVVPHGDYAVAISKECYIDSRGMACVHAVSDVVHNTQFPRGWGLCSLAEYWRNHARVARELINPKQAIAKERKQK